MKSPDITLRVEIRPDAAYISHEEIKGQAVCQLEHLEKERLCYQVVLIRLLRAI